MIRPPVSTVQSPTLLTSHPLGCWHCGGELRKSKNTPYGFLGGVLLLCGVILFTLSLIGVGMSVLHGIAYGDTYFLPAFLLTLVGFLCLLPTRGQFRCLQCHHLFPRHLPWREHNAVTVTLFAVIIFGLGWIIQINQYSIRGWFSNPPPVPVVSLPDPDPVPSSSKHEIAPVSEPTPTSPLPPPIPFKDRLKIAPLKDVTLPGANKGLGER